VQSLQQTQFGQLLGLADLRRIQAAHDAVVLQLRSAGGRADDDWVRNATATWDALIRELTEKVDPPPD
jgi:hypothetical protein